MIPENRILKKPYISRAIVQIFDIPSLSFAEIGNLATHLHFFLALLCACLRLLFGHLQILLWTKGRWFLPKVVCQVIFAKVVFAKVGFATGGLPKVIFPTFRSSCRPEGGKGATSLSSAQSDHGMYVASTLR